MTGIGQTRYKEFFGIYSAVVHNNNDPYRNGRVKLKIPQIMGTAISNWATPISTGSVPSVGQEVMTMFSGGDVNYPVYFISGDKSSNVIQEYAPSNDPTGVEDYNSLSAALSEGSVSLAPGTYTLSQPLIWSSADLSGCGNATIIQPVQSTYGTWSGSALLEPGSDAQVRNLKGYGGTGTRSANPAVNFIQIQAGATFWKVCDIQCNNMNGYIVFCAPSTGSHGTIRTVKAEHNGGGIRIDNGTGGSTTAEINMADLDIQNCETNEILFLSAVTDILVNILNGSISGSTAINGITVQGSCQTCQLYGLDVGGGRGTGVLVFQKAGTSSPTDIIVTGKVQSGVVGLVVNDSTARCQFVALESARNQTDGIQVNSTGGFLAFIAPMMNLNNQSATTGYDFNVTSTGHVLISGPSYVSGGSITANLNITSASNHVTEANPNSGRTTAGNAPAGW